MTIDREEAKRFLERVWNVDDIEARIIEVVLIGSRGTRTKQLDTIELGYRKAIDEALEWIEANTREGDHVYYAVLPRARKAPRGKRGSSTDVKAGKWLWADLDFKETIHEAETLGCSEGEDHRLECVYEEGSKIIRVNRPPLSDILERLRKIDLEPTIIVDSGAGYHFYWELEDIVDARILSKIENLLIDTLKGLGYPVDPQTRDLARILRLPGSINPRVKRIVNVLKDNQKAYAPEELRARLEELKVKREELSRKVGGLRELRDTDIIAIKESLKEAWMPGRRQYLALFLTGWLAKAQVSPLSAAKLIRSLAEETGDTELEERLSTIYYSYRKALGERVQEALAALDTLIEEWKSQGILTRNVSKGVQYEGVVKGKTGVQEVLEEVLGEDRALDIIREIEETLEVASPYRDATVLITDFTKHMGYANVPRKKRIYRVIKENNGIKYERVVWEGAITDLVVYENPLGGGRKIKIVWESATLRRPLIVGPGSIADIYARLRQDGFLLNSRLGEDALHHVITGLIKYKRAEIREDLGAPGFYLIDGKIGVVGWKPEEVTKEELREALDLLNELVEVWFRYAQERFVSLLKYGAISPFIFIRKQLGRQYAVPYPTLYGARDTGKTTQAEIAVLHLWGLNPNEYIGEIPNSVSARGIRTEARLARAILPSSTFGIVINEANSLFVTDNGSPRTGQINIIKQSVEGVIVGGRFEKGVYVNELGLRPLVFTLNPQPPVNFEALMLVPKTLYLIRYTEGERISRERKEEFQRKVEPQLPKLKAIGHTIAQIVLDEGLKILKETNWLKLGEKLLRRVYEKVELEPPEWLSLEYRGPSFEEVEQEKTEEFRVKLVKYINEQYSRHVSRIIAQDAYGYETVIGPEDVPLERKLGVLLRNKIIPFFMTGRNNTIYITKSIIQELGLQIDSLKSLAELLGWSYTPNHTIRVRNGKTTSTQAIKVTLNELLDFINAEGSEGG